MNQKAVMMKIPSLRHNHLRMSRYWKSPIFYQKEGRQVEVVVVVVIVVVGGTYVLYVFFLDRKKNTKFDGATRFCMVDPNTMIFVGTQRTSSLAAPSSSMPHW